MAGALILCVSWLAHHTAVAVISGRARPPFERRAGAERAVEAARRGRALRWAPEEFQAAETELRHAGAAEWSEADGLWLRRDYRPVGDRLWRAETLAMEAERLGAERRDAARSEATERIEETAALLNQAERLAAATALGYLERVHLTRARVALDESRGLVRAEEFPRARERCETARRELDLALRRAVSAAERYTSRKLVRAWTRWIEETRAWSRASGIPAAVVIKEKNLLMLVVRGRVVRSYAADVGRNPLDRKLRAGDRATPEGQYRVVKKKGPGQSRYYKAMLLDYPNAADRQRLAEAKRAGMLPPAAGLGGLIEIHGEGGRGRNTTDGCVAVSNSDMDELFDRLHVGSWVTIVGGDGANGTFSDFVSGLRELGGGP